MLIIHSLPMAINIIVIVCGIINFYAFFTYIGDLNATKCSCAVDKQPTLNSIMNALRWFQLVAYGLSLLSILYIIYLFYGLNILANK